MRQRERDRERETYIFEEALHEGEPDVVGRAARVCRVDVLLVAGGQLLRLLVPAAVPQHYTAIREHRTRNVFHSHSLLNE